MPQLASRRISPASFSRLACQPLAAKRLASEPAKPSATGIDWSHSAVLGQRGAAARNFADLVAVNLVGPVLPWTQRQALIRQAARRNITRFEANLIIAAVQNHFEHRHAASPAPVGHRARTLGIGAWAVTVAAIEAAIILAFCYVRF